MTKDRNAETSIDEQIAANLRRAYKEKLEETIPDRFLDLLKQLRDQDGGADAGEKD